MDRPPIVIVLTTWPAQGDAGGLATTLVSERLAACVSILPEMESVYSWRGELQRDRERQLLVKTSRARLDALKKRLGELHPYEVPELLVVEVDDGSDAYLEWLQTSTNWAPAPGQS